MLLDTLNPATLLSGRYKQEQIPDLSGKTAIVTGGSAGIGYHDALGLARAGAKVLILSANPEHGGTAEGEMNSWLKQHGGPKAGSVKWYQVDMADMKAVDTLAKQLKDSEDRLDILINNASIGQAPHDITKDGLERHFAINNLSHFILTLRLLPLMKKTAETAPPASVRVVFQSSELHKAAPSDTKFASVEEINANRDGTLLYGRSKLGMILFGRQLVKRKLPSGPNTVIVTSVHPGTVDTEIQKAWTESYGFMGSITESFMRVVGKSAPEGAEASLWAATCTDINATTYTNYQGNYYSEAYGKDGQDSNQARDEALGDAFWELSKERAQAILGEDVTA